MYEKHFGLTRRPFGPAADHVLGPPSRSQEAAVDQLTRAIAAGSVVNLLAGECGVGKSWLLQRLIDRFEGQRTIHWLPFTLLADAAALFQTLLFDLDQPFAARAEPEARLLYTAAVLQSFTEGRPVLLLIDEAQNLSIRLLEEVRQLSNLDAGGKPAMQVLLAGRPDLLTTLQRPELQPLCQRVSVRCVLEPLDADEAVAFIKKRLAAVGGRPERVIGDEAVEALAVGTHGIIRLIHQVADRALQLTAEAGQPIVELEVVLAALQEYGLDGDISPLEPGCDEEALSNATRVPVGGTGIPTGLPLGLVQQESGVGTTAGSGSAGKWQGQRRTA